MGQVWKARDTSIALSQPTFRKRISVNDSSGKLKRSPPDCTLRDVGPNYLVMEYTEATPLKGPLPVDQALKFAAQICDALDAAHKKRITYAI